MSDIVIHAEGLGKRYHIGATPERYQTLRDSITKAAMRPIRALARRNGRRDDEATTIWAVRDVGFDVKRGEVVGIIGRNGAGKSTLLKILARITEPTKGFAEIRGRVGSLLEVGTGFHAELTGRENTFLNGAILGMKRNEIERKFDEIVEFSEVGKFIDTPVKHYSSGMYLRLAFAVAAHLEPEILIVDEVLAVGDARFQKKCLNKMQDVGERGRTVLFVSHNMSSITRLCQRTILLDAGRVLEDGPSHQVVGAYLRSGLGTTAAREWGDPAKAPGDDVARLCAVRVKAEDGRTADAVDIRKPIGLELEWEVLRPGYVLVPNFGVTNEEGISVFVTADRDPEWRGRPRPRGRFVSTVWIPANFMAEGTFTVGTGVNSYEPFRKHCDEPHAVAFQVVDSLDGNSTRGDYAGRYPGVVRPLLPWRHEFHDGAREITAATEAAETVKVP
jgi:lipopolysaccharide transport system ATP-binding protein